MLGFIKKLFGGKTETTAEAPYKIETPVAVVPPSSTVAEPAPKFDSDWPFPAGTPGSGTLEPVETPKKKPAAKKPAGEKKPAVKAKTARVKKAPAKKSK